MSDAFIGDNLPSGSARRTRMGMGMILIDSDVTMKRDLPLGNQGDVVKPQAGPGVFGVDAGQVLGRCVTSDHQSTCIDPLNAERGERVPVWNAANSLNIHAPFAVAGVSVSGHTGHSVAGQQARVDLAVAGLVTVTQNTSRLPFCQGDPVLVRMPAAVGGPRKRSPLEAGRPNSGARPLVLEPPSRYNDALFDRSSLRYFEEMCDNFESVLDDPDDTFQYFAALSDLFRYDDDGYGDGIGGEGGSSDGFDHPRALWPCLDNRPALLDLLDPIVHRMGGLHQVNKHRFLEQLRTFCQTLELETKRTQRVDGLMIFQILQMVVAHALASEQLQIVGDDGHELPCVTGRFTYLCNYIISQHFGVVTARQSRHCYQHILGWATKTTAPWRPLEVLLR